MANYSISGTVVFSALAVLITPVSAKSERLTLSPVTSWQLDYAEDKCRLARKFSDGTQEATLFLDQSGSEPFYTVIIISDLVKRTRGETISIAFGPFEQPAVRSFIGAKFGDEREAVVMHGVTLAPKEEVEGSRGKEFKPIRAIGAEREAAIKTITLSQGIPNEVILETGSLKEPLDAMRNCTDNLVKYLGIGGDNPRELLQEPTPIKINRWIGPSDYPVRYLERDREGVVRFRLTVDKDGKPSACHVIDSTRPAIFDDTVCHALIKRASFKPALDLDGNPVAATFSSAVRFEAP